MEMLNIKCFFNKVFKNCWSLSQSRSPPKKVISGPVPAKKSFPVSSYLQTNVEGKKKMLN